MSQPTTWRMRAGARGPGEGGGAVGGGGGRTCTDLGYHARLPGCDRGRANRVVQCVLATQFPPQNGTVPAGVDERAWWEFRRAFQRTPVNPEGLARLVAEVVPGGRGRALVGRLKGGSETAANALELVDAAGVVTRAVLKRRPDPRFDGAGEWAGLRAATEAAVPTPEPLGFDPDGRWFGGPALVMSRLRGRADLGGGTGPGSLRQLAHALAAVHDCGGEGLAEARPRWRRPCPEEASDYERRVWADVHQRAAAAGPATALVHLDFHPGNALWFRGRLSGIIDWENAARGWPAEDVAKCRLYFASLHGFEVADGFLAAYEAETGGSVRLRAIADMSYAIGIWRQADWRAEAMRRIGYPDMTGDGMRSVCERFIVEAAESRSQ